MEEKYRGWVALRPLRVAGRVVRPGSPLPEAEDFPLRDQLVTFHEIGWEGDGLPPMRFMRLPEPVLAVHDRMIERVLAERAAVQGEEVA